MILTVRVLNLQAVGPSRAQATHPIRTGLGTPGLTGYLHIFAPESLSCNKWD